MAGMDPRYFDRLVLGSIDAILARVRLEHLALPTPCDGWNLDRLLGHMIASHRGFAAAARLEPPDPGRWDAVDPGPDPYGAYGKAAAEATEAFEAIESLDQPMEIYPYGTFSASIALRMHAVDFLAHGWDVAKAIGTRSTLDGSLAREALAIARTWPANAFGSDAPFADHVDVGSDDPVDQALVAYLGRDPNWPRRRRQ